MITNSSFRFKVWRLCAAGFRVYQPITGYKKRIQIYMYNRPFHFTKLDIFLTKNHKTKAFIQQNLMHEKVIHKKTSHRYWEVKSK
ncbi:hypothetical protein BOQ62_17730 [Chryseobacterium sp. CH21]|nr:hypothetical protein BOQ62_17730 [Chryseobacterium sp. CH21]